MDDHQYFISKFQERSMGHDRWSDETTYGQSYKIPFIQELKISSICNDFGIFMAISSPKIIKQSHNIMIFILRIANHEHIMRWEIINDYSATLHFLLHSHMQHDSSCTTHGRVICQHMIGEWHVCTDNGGHPGISTDAGRWCAPQSTQFQRMSPRRHWINVTLNPIHPTDCGRMGKGYASPLGWGSSPTEAPRGWNSIIECITRLKLGHQDCTDGLLPPHTGALLQWNSCYPARLI